MAIESNKRTLNLIDSLDDDDFWEFTSKFGGKRHLRSRKDETDRIVNRLSLRLVEQIIHAIPR